MHMATGAVVNAVWDLAAKRAGVPLWKLLADAEPEWLADQVDSRYISDARARAEAVSLLRRGRQDKERREPLLMERGYPAYTTSPGWLGYSDEKLTRLAQEAVAAGFRQIKLKVGADLADDVRRFKAARAAVGPELRIAIDANQRWSVPEAVEWVRALAEFDPYWIEEPTSPDDVLGHAAIRAAVRPVKVATGEHVQNRVVFKQLLQAQAIDVLQLDAARVGGVNENLAILLLAAKFGVPVCPHAGGGGRCELGRRPSVVGYGALSRTPADRGVAFVGDDDSVREAVGAACSALRGLDVLVNNAGIGATGTIEDNSDEQWRQVWDVNVIGMVRVSRAALPRLRASSNAAIVNTCSIAATAGLPQRALYSATKGAVLSLTLAMAADHVREGIRVNCVNPGTVDTPWVR